MAPNGGGNTVITFSEVDELNNPTATFIYSEPPGDSARHISGKNGQLRSRVDIAYPSSGASASWSLRSLQSLLIDVFLPVGYPHSVSEDYASYQIFDSLQAFSSSIAGLLSSRAVLQGVGVGNANASPTSALLLHILQDSSGRIATILFAHRVGTALEPECKMYRLAADVFNDLAMILDCLSPMIPAGASRVSILSAAGVLRALCGVAGGSSKASLSAHFSRWGNLAEVNAKDSSQETIVSLMGMLVGSLVVSRVTSLAATWLCLFALLTLHLSLNYAAVRSVQMTTLNRQRANIVFSTLLSSDPDLPATLSRNPQQGQSIITATPTQILTPAQVATQERIFERTGRLGWTSPLPLPSTKPVTLGTCQIGISFHNLLPSQHKTSPPTSTSYTSHTSITPLPPIREISSLFAKEAYLLFISQPTPTTSRPRHNNLKASILLKATSTAKTQLKAWMHALLAAHILSQSEINPRPDPGTETETDAETDMTMDILERSLSFLNTGRRFEGYLGILEEVGWDTGIGALETRPGRRVVV